MSSRTAYAQLFLNVLPRPLRRNLYRSPDPGCDQGRNGIAPLRARAAMEPGLNAYVSLELVLRFSRPGSACRPEGMSLAEPKLLSGARTPGPRFPTL